MEGGSMNQIKTNAGQNYLSEDEEKKLLNALRIRKECMAERDFVLIKLCRVTGLRRGEAVGLNVGDVFGKEKIIINERLAKKGGLGEVYIPKELQDILKKFCRLKKSWGESLESGAPLFISKKGNRLSIRSFNDLMTKWCNVAGIPRYTPHALRHTKGQRIMADIRHLSDDEQKKKLHFANKQLRHRSLNSTLIYTVPTKEEMETVGKI